MHRSVHFYNPFGRVARALMESVDILRDERKEFAAALEIDQCSMTRVGLCRPRWIFEPRLPCRLAHFTIGNVVTNVGHFLGGRVSRP